MQMNYTIVTILKEEQPDKFSWGGGGGWCVCLRSSVRDKSRQSYIVAQDYTGKIRFILYTQQNL